MTRGIWIVLAVALVLRLLVIGSTHSYAPYGDAADYNRIAATFAITGHWAPTIIAEPGGDTAFRPPGYPLLLSAIYKVFGVRYTIARGVGALLGTLAVLLLYLLVVRIADRRLALWTAAVAAVGPLTWLSGTLLSENLFIPIVFGCALCVAAHRDRQRLWLAVLAGLLLGLASSTRGNGLALIIPLALGLATGPRRWLAPLVAVACTLVVLVPWTLRNESTFHRFLPLGTQSGFTMAGQWNTQAAVAGKFHAVWILPQSVPAMEPLFRKPGLDEAEQDTLLRKAAKHYAVHHPKEVVEAVAFNLMRSFDVGPGHSFVARSSFTELGQPESRFGGMHLEVWLFSLLSFAGLAIGLRRRTLGPLWLWLFPALTFAGGVLWLGNPRHAEPLYAFFTIPCAIALMRATDALRARRAR